MAMTPVLLNQPPGAFSFYSQRTTGFTVSAIHLGTVFDCSGTSFAVTAAPSLGAGFQFEVYASGSNTYTVTASSGTIQGPAGSATTLALTTGQGAVFESDGTNWKVVSAVGLPASGTTAINVADTLFTVFDDADNTKKFQFQANTIATGTTRTYSVPDATTTLAALSVAQTFSAKQTFATATSPAAAVQGAASSLTAGPDFRFQFTGDPDAALSYFIFAHDSLGIFYDCYFNGVNNIASNTTAYQIYKTSGTLNVYGYSGLTKGNSFSFGAKSLTIGVNATAATSSITGTLVIGDGSTVASNVGIGGGRVNIGATTASSSTTTGALVVAGGAGVAGAINAGGNIIANGPAGTLFQITAAGGSTWDLGDGIGASNGTFVLYDVTHSRPICWGLSTGEFVVKSTTASSSTTTGALQVAGGAGVVGNLCLDGSTGASLRIATPAANAAVATTLGSVGPTGSTAGNPQGWLRLNVAGTDRFIPFW